MERRRPLDRSLQHLATLGTCQPGDVVDLYIRGKKDAMYQRRPIVGAVVKSVTETQAGNPAVVVQAKGREMYLGGGTAVHNVTAYRNFSSI